MYEAYFGLSARPFDLTPDPEYLFLTRQHQEALAHLLYGITQRKGFILITGEVGSGKTTLCRALLEEIGPDTRTALVLNPFLSELDLLHAILNEYGVECHSANKAELLEALNRFLLDSNAQGDTVVLVVDEAQHLPPESLEQLRMLSNLETTKEKLIQIVLVGQPELQEVLARPSMKQLNQRFTVRYHIGPLSAAETTQYIEHRLALAGGGGKVVFNPSAVEVIFTASGGIPRVINAICDRSLLVASLGRSHTITSQHAWQAAEEVGASARPSASSAPATTRLFRCNPRLAQLLAVAAIFACLLFLGLEVYSWLSAPVPATPAPAVVADAPDAPDSPPAHTDPLAHHHPAQPAVAEIAVVTPQQQIAASAPAPGTDTAPVAAVEPPASVAITTPAFDEYGVMRCQTSDPGWWAATLTLLRWHGAREDELARHWQPAPADYAAGLAQLGWQQRPLAGDWSRIVALGLPVLVSIPDGLQQRQLVWIGTHDGVEWFADPLRGMLHGDPAQLLHGWQGAGFTVVPDGAIARPILRQGDAGPAVVALHTRLEQLNLPTDDAYGRFGPATQAAVRRFQQRHQLLVDGVVGPETQLWLYGRWWSQMSQHARQEQASGRRVAAR